MNKVFKLIIFSLTLLMMSNYGFTQQICPLDSSAFKPKEVTSLDSFKKIPILDNGRIKPLDSYARNTMLQFSGLRKYQDEEAISWLTRLLFAPQQTRNDKIFLINSPDISQALGIKEEKKRRYSFAQIEPKLEILAQLASATVKIDKKERDVVENEILRVYDNVKFYSILSLSFSFSFPHPDFTITDNTIYT